MQRALTSPYRWVALIAAAYLILILLVKNQYYQLMMTLVPVWATMGLSWNILSGYSGLVSFGHASFFGLGAYTVALSLINFGLTPWIGIPIAAASSGSSSSPGAAWKCASAMASSRSAFNVRPFERW